MSVSGEFSMAIDKHSVGTPLPRRIPSGSRQPGHKCSRSPPTSKAFADVANGLHPIGVSGHAESRSICAAPVEINSQDRGHHPILSHLYPTDPALGHAAMVRHNVWTWRPGSSRSSAKSSLPPDQT